MVCDLEVQGDVEILFKAIEDVILNNEIYEAGSKGSLVRHDTLLIVDINVSSLKQAEDFVNLNEVDILDAYRDQCEGHDIKEVTILRVKWVTIDRIVLHKPPSYYRNKLGYRTLWLRR